VTYDDHLDQLLSEDKERRAGLHDPDLGSPAWCERYGRIRVRGCARIMQAYSYARPEELATFPPDAFLAMWSRVDYVPRAVRAWFPAVDG